MSKITRRTLAIIAALVVGMVALSGCTSSGGNKHTAQQNGVQISQNRNNYKPVNDVEGQNYNARQRLADQPATIIWCTAYPTNPNAKVFTVPIVGKLTSGNKRPDPTTQAKYDSNGSGTYNTDLPDSAGFYGSSGDYRYGFDPAGGYHDFYNMETYCTTVPDIIQQQTTQIDISVKGDLQVLDRQAEAALAICHKISPDPSKSCPAAAAILGVG